MNPAAAKKIWFLQLVRAIACLLIVYVHWITFMLTPNVLAAYIFQTPLQNYPDIPIARNILASFWIIIPNGFSEALFALGLFFIISGFVIPLSIGKSPIEFLTRRLLRIYPTLIVCLLLVCLIFGIGRMMDGLPFHVFTFKTIYSNLLLLRDFFKKPYIENGTWTLEIELHFYLLCFFLAFFKGHQRSLALLSIAVFFFILSKSNMLSERWFAHVFTQAGFLMFMLVGTCLYNWHYEFWNGKKTAICIAILMAFSKYFYVISNAATSPQTIYVNHFFVLATFVCLLVLNDRLPYLKWFDKIANASYPLYLIHGFFGYTVYFILFKLTASVLFAFLTTFAIIIGLTVLLHCYLELPMIAYAKSLFKRNRKLPEPIKETILSTNNLSKESV